MIRPILIAAAVIALAACQPATAPAEPADAAPPAPEPVEISTIYDWSWRAHGGSADLDFGDGEWAEGVSLFHLSCLPNSQKVGASWGNGDPATLSSGGQSIQLAATDEATAADHPVFKALRASAEITVSQAASAKRLVGKADGKQAVEEFFAYCTSPPA